MRSVLTILAKAIFVFSLSTAVYALPSEPAKEEETKKCPVGTSYDKTAKACVCENKKFIWSEKAKKCVKKTAEILTDEDLYKKAVALINAKEYKTALDVLWRIKDQNQPRVLNYIGFANRKLGKIDKGIGYYYKALKINANYHQARQYLGEGYLQKGDLNSAQNQLDEIAKRCGVSCNSYKTLAEQIRLFKERKA